MPDEQHPAIDEIEKHLHAFGIKNSGDVAKVAFEALSMDFNITAKYIPPTYEEENARRKAAGGVPICEDCDQNFSCTMNCGPASGVDYWSHK